MTNQSGPTLYTPEPVMACNGCFYCSSVQSPQALFFLCQHPDAAYNGGLSQNMTIDGDKIRTPEWCPVIKERGEG